MIRGQFITYCLCCCSSSEGGLLSLFQHGEPPPEDCSMNFSTMSSSHRLQFFINCSSVDLFHRVQSCRNRFQCRVTSCSTAFPWGHSLPQASTCPGMELSTSGSLLCHGLSWAAGGQFCLTVVFITDHRGIYALVPGASPALPSLLALVSAGMFLSHTIIPLFSGCNLPLCNNFPSQIQDSRGATTTPDRQSPALGLSLALSDMEEASGSLLEKLPL